ncbi:uncharacterized protein TNCV_2201281 [Trichonephila clavipes]|uniref:Uncharacterized protein n=1 Tax=Trichonephila clavipes TaxID=2585209 RepID=A0A8X6SGI7_TRICX|nr:uncharacterized protein TNCV_2201281 [Trichonephila clavipes]
MDGLSSDPLTLMDGIGHPLHRRPLILNPFTLMNDISHPLHWVQSFKKIEVINTQHSPFPKILLNKLPTYQVAAVAEWYRHRIVAGFVTSSSPVPLKTRRVGQRCTLNLSEAEMSSRWCGVVVRRGMPAQVSSTSLDYGSKLRGPSPKALVQLNSATLIFTHSPSVSKNELLH